MKIYIVARKKLEINIVTRHKLPDPLPPQNQMFCCICVSSVGFACQLMQYNAHKTGMAPVGPNVVCLCLHIKKEMFNAHFILAQYLAILHLIKKGVTQKFGGVQTWGACVYIKNRGEDHFYTLNAHFIFAKSLRNGSNELRRQRPN